MNNLKQRAAARADAAQELRSRLSESTYVLVVYAGNTAAGHRYKIVSIHPYNGTQYACDVTLLIATAIGRRYNKGTESVTIGGWGYNKFDYLFDAIERVTGLTISNDRRMLA